VLDAAEQARGRYAYAEQLRLLERALELWESVPAGDRAGLRLRPVAPIWAYPRGECGDQRLDHVDLLAEATMAGLLSDQPDRAMTISRRALKELDEAAEPLRAAWFVMQRSRMMTTLGRDGLAELTHAQELLRGLPPSVVHAQVTALLAATHSMSPPSPGTFELAERAVSLARLVGEESTELYGRFTLACLTADAGQVAEGIAEMEAVLDRVLEREDIGLLGRCLVNFAATLAEVGQLDRAVEMNARGMELAHRYGLEDTKGWLSSNHAWSLLHLARWDEAESALAVAHRQARDWRPRSGAGAVAAILALQRGQRAAARRHLASVRASTPEAGLRATQNLMIARIELELAATEGRIEQAREIFASSATGRPPPFLASLVWELALVAASAEAETRGLPRADRERPAALGRIREVVGGLPRATPLGAAFGGLVDAELRRAEGCDTPADWEAVDATLDAVGLCYHLARARRSWAEALLDAGSAECREQAAGLLRGLRATAERLGAAPLRERVEQLAARARIDLSPSAALAPAPVEPAPAAAADPFGLTRRERDVLALVAEGRSNRQIAEELFISPKTASVHVSNILAKLEVSGRGEAAALAHRLRLVPASAES
jgi:DNA-binding CsgD family transcriptional regulator